MAESERVTFRMPKELRVAATKKRGDQDEGAYLRSLVAKDVKLEGYTELPRGMAGAAKGVAKKAGAKGGRPKKKE